MTDLDNLIEAVARVLYECNPACVLIPSAESMIPWDRLSPDDKQAYLPDAKAAILATLEGIREPTNGMAVAGWREADKFGVHLGNGRVARIYTAMLTTLLASMKDPDNG